MTLSWWYIWFGFYPLNFWGFCLISLSNVLFFVRGHCAILRALQALFLDFSLLWVLFLRQNVVYYASHKSSAWRSLAFVPLLIFYCLIYHLLNCCDLATGSSYCLSCKRLIFFAVQILLRDSNSFFLLQLLNHMPHFLGIVFRSILEESVRLFIENWSLDFNEKELFIFSQKILKQRVTLEIESRSNNVFKVPICEQEKDFEVAVEEAESPDCQIWNFLIACPALHELSDLLKLEGTNSKIEDSWLVKSWAIGVLANTFQVESTSWNWDCGINWTSEVVLKWLIIILRLGVILRIVVKLLLILILRVRESGRSCVIRLLIIDLVALS